MLAKPVTHHVLNQAAARCRLRAAGLYAFRPESGQQQRVGGAGIDRRAFCGLDLACAGQQGARGQGGAGREQFASVQGEKGFAHLGSRWWWQVV